MRRLVAIEGPMTRERALREKQSYDEGGVFEASARLHARFEHVFTGTNSRAAEEQFSRLITEAAKGTRVLSYGGVRGNLLMPAVVAGGPRRFVVVDISRTEVEAVKHEWGPAADYSVMDAHSLAVQPESFDLVVGRSIVHHLDYEAAIREIHRVLAPGGVAVFVEPLRDNPLLKLGRLLTPWARTKDELPLSADQIRFADHLFGRSRHLFFNLVSVPAGMASSSLFASPDNALMRLADRVDRAVAQTAVRYWMRSVVLVWKKAERGRSVE